MNRTKQDKQFTIDFDRSNRDFLMNVGMYNTNMILTVSALLISVSTLIGVSNGFDWIWQLITLCFLVILVWVWGKYLPAARKAYKHANEINKQLQKELLEVYPEYNNKYH